jgi:UDP-GlcNAc:undecaprenyl-phosphate GlcNAc-1-phosphate transferase
MAGQIVAATTFVLVSGVAIRYFGNLFGTGNLGTGPLAVPFTVFAIVSVMNAINLTDGLDGLAGGVSLIALLFLLYFAVLAEHGPVAYMAIAFIGSVIGFLYFNLFPARTFMGDAGSLTLGFVLSALSVLLMFDGRAVPGVIQPITLALIICLPIMDTVSVMIRRLLKGQKLSDPDNRHLHHVLLSLQFSKWATVRIIYLMMVGFGVLALALRGSAEWMQLLCGALLTGIVLYGCFYLQKSNFSIQKLRQTASTSDDHDYVAEEANPAKPTK